MYKLLAKEFRLFSSVITPLFILFGLMFLLPGYPVLCGAFFVTLGIFQSFQYVAENSDILFTVLLPIARRDAVKGKYAYVCLIELCGLALMGVCTVLRMTVLADAAVYRQNAMMNANPFALGMACVIFGLFNEVFVGGFFKTAYRIGRPFVIYAIAAFLTIGLAETLHHIPGLTVVNAFGFEEIGIQLGLMGICVLLSGGMTACSYKRACRRFEKIDL